jgi:hypothetical protein
MRQSFTGGEMELRHVEPPNDASLCQGIEWKISQQNIERVKEKIDYTTFSCLKHIWDKLFFETATRAKNQKYRKRRVRSERVKKK